MFLSSSSSSEEEEEEEEEEEDGESDADLEARAIAAMMRLRREKKRSKAEAKQRAIHFKLRVLDLLETFITVNNKLEQDETRPKPSLSSLLSMFAPLLKATQILQRQVFAGKGHKEAKNLMERLASLFNKKLCKAVVKRTRGGAMQHEKQDTAEVVKTMQEVVDLVLATPNKAKDKGCEMAAVAVSFLFRVLKTLGCERETSVLDGAREQMTRAAKCCFLTKNPKLRITFLELQAQRSPLFAWATLLAPLSKICSASDGEWCPKSAFQRVQCLTLIDLLLKNYRQVFNSDQAVAAKLLGSSFDLLCGGVACIMDLCCQDVEVTDDSGKKQESGDKKVSEAKYLLKAKRLKVILKFANNLVRVWREKLQSAVPATCFSRIQTGVGRLIALRGPGTAEHGVACRSEKVHRTLQQFGATLNKAVANPVAKSKAKTPKKRKSAKVIDGVASAKKSISSVKKKMKVKSDRKLKHKKKKKKKKK